MKLVVQIPAYNEEEYIGEVIKSIPKKINGIDEIEVFVIDDNSSDKTNEISKSLGVKVIKNYKKTGLSNVFKLGVKNSLKLNADILVNIDGDNQYRACDIDKLIKPILDNEADIVVGARPISNMKNFSLIKKILQKFGSYMVKLLSGIDIKDAPSGFRAFNRRALLNINVFNNFTYTIETLIQAKYKNLIVKNVDIEVNQQNNRKSKLFKNNFDYIFKQTHNLIRFFIIYRPQKFFATIANLFFIVGLILGIRFLYFYFLSDGDGHIQSLILCAIIFTISFLNYVLAIVGDLFSINRKILEDIQYEIRQSKYKK